MDQQLEKKQLFERVKNEVFQYREEPFTLVSGRKSHYYFNCKTLTMDPPGLALLTRVLYREIQMPAESGEPIENAIGGMTMGSDPFVYSLALESLAQNPERPLYPLVVRKKAKAHGTGRQVEGRVKAVRGVWLLDDVITTGGSAIQALEALRDLGLKITRALCIIDREEGGREALAEKGVRLFSLFQKSDFFLPGRERD